MLEKVTQKGYIENGIPFDIFFCKTCGGKDKSADYPFLCKSCADLVMVRDDQDDQLEVKYI